MYPLKIIEVTFEARHTAVILGLTEIVLGKVKPLSWYSVGFYYSNMSGTIEHHDWDSYAEADTVVNASSKGSAFGIAYNFFIPTARVGASNLIAVDIGINAGFGLVNGEKSVVRVETPYSKTTTTYSNQGLTYAFAVPVGFQLISGGEAISDRSRRFSFTVGGGVYPMLNMGVIDNFGGISVKIPAYLKGELGIFAGINWKLRAMYVFKSPNSFRGIGDNLATGESNEIRFKADDQLILGLVVQPFSWTWE